VKSERWWTTARAIAYFDLADADAAGLEPERMVETARRIGADAVGLRAAGPSAWYPSALEHHLLAIPVDGPDVLARLVEIAHGEGLRVVAGADFSVAGETVLRLRPEWIARDEHGAPVKADDNRYRTCPLSGFQGAGLAHPALAELAGYDLDALVIHRPAAHRCRCGACRRQFRQASGADLASIGDDLAAHSEWSRWLGATAAAGLAAGIQAARAVEPALPIVVESGGLTPGPADATAMEPPDIHRSGDLLLLRAPSGAFPAPTAGVRTRHGRELNLDGAVWVEPSRSEAGSASGSSPAEAAGILAAGGTVWHRFQKLPGHGAPTLAAHARLVEQRARVDQRLADAASRPPVALVWPDLAAVDRPDAEAARDEFFGFAAAFVAHGVAFTVLPALLLEIDRLSGFAAIALPAVSDLGDRQCHALRRFVAGGGGLLASYTSGLSDTGGNPRRDWDLAALVNAEFDGHILEPGPDCVAVPRSDDWLNAGLPAGFAIPAARRQTILRPAEDRSVLMSLEYRGRSDPLPTDIPYLLGSDDGQVIYCAGEIGRIARAGNTPGVGRLLANAIRRAAGGFAVELRPTPDVELHVRRGASRVFAHLRRLADFPDDAADVAVGLTFAAGRPPVQANLVAAGEPAELEIADGCAWAIVPRLGAWELVEFVLAD
jgi:hypothetical protein